MGLYEDLEHQLLNARHTWLVTGVAGFIGSNLLQALLELDQTVVGFDNFSTGKKQNLLQVQSLVRPEQWSRFEFKCGDIRDVTACQEVCHGVDYILHQAALGSVPRSMLQPLESHASNVTGFLNMLVAARDQKVRRFVYASSSSVYGDHPGLPKVEEMIGQPLSPYAATKVMNELYAGVFAKAYGIETIGLRYFNVFGPRQDPDGAYAAVIPKWTMELLRKKPVRVNGDGQTSRDFCYVDNVVQANLLAASTRNQSAINEVYNVAVGDRTSLNELFASIQGNLRKHHPNLPEQRPVYCDFRPGDVRHSLADISKAQRLLGYAPRFRLAQGLEKAVEWYRTNL